MTNLYLFFDSRSARKDGTGTLKLALTHKSKTVYQSLGIRVKPDEWDTSRSQVVGRADKKFLNVEIRKRYSDALVCLQRLECRTDFDRMASPEILSMLMRNTNVIEDTGDGDFVIPVFNEYITLCRTTNTASSYRCTLNSIKEFEPEVDTLRFKDINVAWLRKYQQWLLDTKGMAVNGGNVYLRNLRTIFNYARNNELTTARYPFRDIDMSTTEPQTEEIPYDDLLDWITVPINPDVPNDRNKPLYRDLFMLSFYLCGIRPVDLLHAKKNQVIGDRLVYYPQKLGGRTKLSIKIEPEAWEIIHRHEGEVLLLDCLEKRTDYKQFCKQWNSGLRSIGYGYVPWEKHHIGVLNHITAYDARRCWGTYQYNLLDTPMDIISQAFGHKSGLRVTNFYVKRDMSKVDKVNRALIDRVTKDMKKRAKKWKGVEFTPHVFEHKWKSKQPAQSIAFA